MTGAQSLLCEMLSCGSADLEILDHIGYGYCLHHNLDVDTASYDSDLRELWEAVAADEEDMADWSDFDSFGNFMCRYLV